MICLHEYKFNLNITEQDLEAWTIRSLVFNSTQHLLLGKTKIKNITK